MSDLTHRSIPCEAHEFEDENRNAPYKFITITTTLLVFASFSTNEKQNPKPIVPCTRDFSRALGIVIGSTRCLFLL